MTKQRKMKGKSSARLECWLSEPLAAEVGRAIDRLRRFSGVSHVAVMPDVHLAQDICIGTVVATESRILPQAVGADIGCGMAAIRFDYQVTAPIEPSLGRATIGSIRAKVPIVRHRSLQNAPGIPDELVDRVLSCGLSDSTLSAFARRNGHIELGTLGRGNHFIELQADEENTLWLMLHSGSRCMGQAITQFHLSRAKCGTSGLRYFDADTPEGQAYLQDVAWARAYARRNRDAMMNRIIEVLVAILGANAIPDSALTCDHNHVQRETHFGRKYWVHRKGAISARENEIGIVPGSMGTTSFHVLGRGHAPSLCSSSHGAGRILCRTEARRKITSAALVQQMAEVYFDESIAKSLIEEAPSAYKDINDVMRAQKPLTRILRRLRPILIYKGI
ncbi:MAG: RtcB family protein [Phycisphaerae bacterium]